MGGKLSNLFGGKDDENDEDENLRRYQEKLDGDGTFGYSDDLDKKKVNWRQWLLFDKRMRIVCIFILGVLLGLIIPAIIFAVTLASEGKPIYGSCMIEEHARFECLINWHTPVTEKDCVRAECCWENINGLQYNCYHSLPSAYQYNISTSRTYGPISTENGTLPARANQAEVISTWAQLDMTPAHPELMQRLRVLTHWESREHLVVEIFNSAVFPDRTVPTTKASSKSKNDNGISGDSGVGGSTQFDDDTTLPLNISWGEDKNLFFIRIGRRETDETIFDTRLGPVYTSGNNITLATLLPTEFFYGLKGGQGSANAQTYGVVNGFENSEFPFYISFEVSGKWHGVLIDTNDPILAQVVQAPGLILHLETDRPEMNLHFFAGPTQPEILAQLHAHLQAKHQITHPPMIPSYWGLGLHLCRKLENSSYVLRDIQALLPDDKPPPVVYDSDCIDEYLRHPIFVNEAQFSQEDLTGILALLQGKEKRVVLSQKTTVPSPPVEEVEEIEEGIAAGVGEEEESVNEWEMEQEFFENLLLLVNNEENEVVDFNGQVDDATVNYLDFFNPNFTKEFPPVPKMSNLSDAEPLPCNGFSIDDNIPRLDFSREHCQDPGSKLQSFFTTTFLTSSSSHMNTSALWGTVCPETLHNLTNPQNGAGKNLARHLNLHNVNGEQALKKVYSTIMQRNESGMLLTSGSFWTTSMYYGGYNGMQVPFTWNGLKESVSNTVRNYALAPISGTPICGGMMWNVTMPKSDELCLRWFQFGLLLPLARNSYDKMSSYGPLDLPGQFQGYLNESIRARYTLAPYYYTTLHAFQKTYIPLIRPMSFDFSRPHERNQTLPLLDQFMVGDAIFAAPIIDRGVNRRAYFPLGAWYAMDGLAAWDSETSGDSLAITGHITETPMFLRGGYTIPTLQYPGGLSIQDSILSGNNYTLIAALSTTIGSIRTSKGSLTVKEPSANTVHLVDFSTSLNQTARMINITINSTCGTPNSSVPTTISTTIDSIRIFGVTFLGKLDVTIQNPTETYSATRYYGDAERWSLRLFGLRMDWCKHATHEVIVKQSVEGGETTTKVSETMPPTTTTTTDAATSTDDSETGTTE